MKIFKTSKSVIKNIDDFYDTIDIGLLNFKEGLKHYLDGNLAEFEKKLRTLEKLEGKADAIKRSIENEFYLHSILPNFSSDVLRLLEKSDDIIDMAKENLSQFDVEIPNIPEVLINDFIRLADISVAATENVIPSARIFFTSPDKAKEGLQKVAFYEREADKLANQIKRKLFREMDELKLSEKIHLRYFALHIEEISDASELVSNILSALILKSRM
ncbi:MAG: DUF47 family protein [Bacteroidales bacterium]|nr:DUF47 family protein [Bacteroidales bacterium]